MKVKVKNSCFAYLFLFLLNLPAAGFLIGNFFIPVLFVLEGFIIIFLLIFNKHFLNDIYLLCKKTPCYYMVLFFLWAAITIIISVIQRTFYFKSFIFSFIGGLIFCLLCPLILSYFINKKIISADNFIKFYVVMCFFVFGLGIIEYAIRQNNLDLANFLMSFFNNRRMMLIGDDSAVHLISKVKSIFDEPSNFGEFIYLNIPIIYSLALSKYKIFRNKFADKFSKSILIPLTAINLILTKSPISLVFFIVVTLFYFYKKIFYIIKKHFAIIVLLLFYIFLPLMIWTLNAGSFNIEETYLKRITATIQNMSSINNLIEVEPSLATRIINYANSILVFFQYPVFGVGYGNMSRYILVQMETSPLPMTPELWRGFIIGAGAVASAIFYRVMAETGIIGYLLIFIFSIKTYFLNKTIIKCSDGLIRDFSIGINAYLIIFMTIVTFYNSNLHNTHYWLIFGYVFAMRFWIQNRRNI